MDHPLFIIFGFILLGLVVIGVSVNAIVAQVLRFKREKEGLRNASAQLQPQTEQLSERTALIEDRVAVLERIATDRGQLLADEIDSLRASIEHTKDKETN